MSERAEHLSPQMREIKGAKLPRIDTRKWTKVADLIWFDGPILSLFRGSKGENILYYWVDSDATSNRWLIFRSSDRDLEDYLAGQTSLHSLITLNADQFLYCCDLDAGLLQSSVMIVSVDEIPADYLPAEDSFYSGQPLPVQLAGTSMLGVAKVSVDGHWDFEDLAKFPRLFREAYAVVNNFMEEGHPASLPDYPMRDGYSVMHFFRHMLASMSVETRPTLRAIAIASPGAILFNANLEVNHVLMSVLHRVNQNTHGAREEYDFLRGVISQNRMMGEDATIVSLSEELDTQFTRHARDLIASMGLPHPDVLREQSPNGLFAAKVALAFYRLIDERLLIYARDERVSFPSL